MNATGTLLVVFQMVLTSWHMRAANGMPSARTNTEVTGYTLGSATYAGGSFQMIDHKWTWKKTDGSTQDVKVIGRDTRSTYVCTTDRRVIQLNYGRHIITMLRPRQHIGTMTSGTAGALSGDNIGKVWFDGGWLQSARVTTERDRIMHKWVIQLHGVKAEYREFGRRNGIVYLVESLSELSIEIDYPKRWVRLTPYGGRSLEVLKITGADYLQLPFRYTC